MIFLIAALFFFPAAAGNSFPVIISKLPVIKNWHTVLDFGKSYRGRRILGDNKTWRGLIAGTLIGGLAGIVISWIRPGIYGEVNPFIVGMLMGFGALAGDAVESFIKRQFDIKPGQTWFPIDQIDYIIGGLAFSSLVFDLDPNLAGAVLITYFLIHLLAVYIGFKIGLRERPI
jgi:CDP-2,3-bis-(O-geranylgeranyl)-sn-glycerol synthase